MSKEKLLKNAEVKWVVEVGPNSNQRQQTQALINILSQAIDKTREETIREVLPEENYGDEDNCSTEYKNGWNDCREKILNKLKK